MIKFIIPLILFITVVIFLTIGLYSDPRLVPSPLINKPAPEFSLQRLHDASKTISLNDIKGEVALVNVWASWCAACRVEHPFLMELAKRNAITIYGLNYKDNRNDALRWLQRFGDPYTAIAFDRLGQTAIDFGVYGAPETFLLDKNGVIVYKKIGPLIEKDWYETILPMIKDMKSKG